MREVISAAVLAALAVGCKAKSRDLADQALAKKLDAGQGTAPPYPPEAEVLCSGQNVPRSLRADATHLYWLNEGSRAEGEAGIFKVAKSGGAPEKLSGGAGSHELAMDDTTIFWVMPRQGDVRKIPKAGGTAEDVATE